MATQISLKLPGKAYSGLRTEEQLEPILRDLVKYFKSQGGTLNELLKIVHEITKNKQMVEYFLDKYNSK